MERDRREYADGWGMLRGVEPRIAGVVVSEDQGVSRGGVVVCVLEPDNYRLKLQKFFEVDARRVREGNGAIHYCAERGRSSYPSE